MTNEWREIPVHKDGRLVVTILKRGTEIHLRKVGDNEKPWLTRALVKQHIAPLLDELGFLTTRTHITDTEVHTWLERCGCTKTWSDDQFQYFILASMPFSRGTQCPQQYL